MSAKTLLWVCYLNALNDANDKADKLLPAMVAAAIGGKRTDLQAEFDNAYSERSATSDKDAQKAISAAWTLFSKRTYHHAAKLGYHIAWDNINGVEPGTFKLVSKEALKLKLKVDWIEPAHYRDFRAVAVQTAVVQDLPAQLNPGVREPAHWFDAGFALAKEEELLIAAIDEVYTDLKLAERIAVARRATIRNIPGVREPAHFRDIIEEIIDVRAGKAAQLGPGIREPAHFRQLFEREDFVRVITELVDMMKKYGM